MSKSIQDLCIFQNTLSSTLKKEISIEIFSDKTFRIWDVGEDEAQLLYDSSEALDNLDINDLPYYVINNLAKEIVDNLSVADIKPEDL